LSVAGPDIAAFSRRIFERCAVVTKGKPVDNFAICDQLARLDALTAP
jgi:hypothetical protein